MKYGPVVLRDYVKQIARLKTTLASQDAELNRVSAALQVRDDLLITLMAQIHSLDIDADVKRRMTNICNTLLDISLLERRIGLELTESDAAFLSKLEEKHQNLTQRELKVAILAKLNYDTRSIARSIGISTKGMESMRYRLHKKLGLEKHQSIKRYLAGLSTK
ncbi:MAG: hypothetical protein WCH05_10725 [Chlorobiaceae bacterium]